MADRTCEKCGKAFRDPSTLRRHCARKTPCGPIVELREDAERAVCRYCGRGFTTPQALSRHTRLRCKIADSEKGMARRMEHTLQRQGQELQQEVAEMKAQVARLAELLEERLAVSPRPGAPQIGP